MLLTITIHAGEVTRNANGEELAVQKLLLMDGQTMRFGRHLEMDVTIHDSQVARWHFDIGFAKGRAWLRDYSLLRRKVPLLLNGRPPEPSMDPETDSVAQEGSVCYLRDQDELSVGSALFRIATSATGGALS